jgi:diphosphomevalonate decarboxylase
MATAKAHTNIALVKYWGKRTEVPERNLPAVGSLSLTLDAFWTTTTVERGGGDRFVLDGQAIEGKEARRVFAFLDQLAPDRPPLVVESENHVPTAAGLASSASAFCALVLAADRELGLDLDDAGRAEHARRGSGSAPRSLCPGFARLDAEPYAVRRLSTRLDVRMLVARCAAGPKAVGSTEGMRRTMATSAYYDAWVATHRQDLDDAEAALSNADLPELGRVMERSTMKMHASALAADPPLWYWNATTWRVLDEVRGLRDGGASAWCTMDAGPHVKILTTPEEADDLAARVAGVEGVLDVTPCAPGPAPEVT